MGSYKVIGLMSGTSLDGLDIAFCTFSEENKKWQFKIGAAETIKYSNDWLNRLRNIETSSALDFAQTHVEYGHYLGEKVKEFIKKNNLHPDFISSHGHTIFHQPDKKLTFQIGAGAALAAECSLPVVCDFRSVDVALGGQGAPLVPIGDKLLFTEYDYCLNLGGFANISYDDEAGKRIAFDTCPVNIVLNELAKKVGQEYDDKGRLASSGKIDTALLEELNALAFYKLHSPKSLGKEWVLKSFSPVLNKYKIASEDALATVVEHIAVQIGLIIKSDNKNRILVTGGGAFNDFLMERLKANCSNELILPSAEIINFKEALIFAFLGVLRWRNEVNCLSSVTGASKDNVGGAIYFPSPGKGY